MKIRYEYSNFIIGSCEIKIKLPVLLNTVEEVFEYLKEKVHNVSIYNYVNFLNNPDLNYERCGFEFWDENEKSLVNIYGTKSNVNNLCLALELYKKYSSKDFDKSKFTFDFLDKDNYSNEELERIAKEIFETFRKTIKGE